MNPSPILTLRNPAVGTLAEIAPAIGFNCFGFQARLPSGDPVELLWAEEGFAKGGTRAAASGNPILFPFVGRLRGTRVALGGREVSLPPGDALGNAIHGFVFDRPWTTTQHDDRHATGHFRSLDFPELAEAWPGPFELQCDYELIGNVLRSRFTASNPGRHPLPLSLGTHPYFRLPLGPRGSADECLIRVPAEEYWELRDMLPTGRRLAADGSRALTAGRRFAECQLDDVYTALDCPGDVWSASIEDRANASRLVLEADRRFRECVVYNPPHRQAVCIEPYTAVPSAPELAARGIDTGWIELPPSESFSLSIVMRLEALT